MDIENANAIEIETEENSLETEIEKVGPRGANGITPTIGENGNWYLGDTDTGKPSRGIQGETGQTGANGRDGVIQYTAGTKISIENNTINSTLTHETWTFTLDDDSTVDKEIVLW